MFVAFKNPPSQKSRLWFEGESHFQCPRLCTSDQRSSALVSCHRSTVAGSYWCNRGSTALALCWSSAEQGVHSQLSGQCAGPEILRGIPDRISAEPVHWDATLRLWSSRSFQFQEVHIAKDQVYEDIQECHTSTSGNNYLGWPAIQHNWVPNLPVLCVKWSKSCTSESWNHSKNAHGF